MNYAYVDGSFSDEYGSAGFGVVLLTPGAAPRHVCGKLNVSDNNAAELRAVAEALRCAPSGEALTIYTDNTNVLSAVRSGSRSLSQHHEAVEVHAEAHVRGIALRLERAGRERRHMQAAHQLANAARLGKDLPPPPAQQVLVNLSQVSWRPGCVVTLRRLGERVSAEVLTLPNDPLPRSVRALLLAAELAQGGETLVVLHASKLAAALWEKPARALADAQDVLRQAKAHTQERGVQVVFERVG